MVSRATAGAILAAIVATPAIFAADALSQSTQYVPPIAEIVRLLESNIPSEQAWGSWLAAQARTADLVPRLRAVADRYRAVEDWREALVASAALDALIQLRASVPAQWSQAFLSKWPAQSIILLSLAGDDAGLVLLDIVRNQRGIIWLAAANQLLARRTAGFAAHLMEDVDISARVIITNDKLQSGFGIGGADVSMGHGGVARLPGFPPLASYYLSGSNPGGVLLTRGPVDTYYFRIVSPPGETAVPIWHDQTAPLARHRFQYAWALLGQSTRPGLLGEIESRSVVWTNQQSLDAEIEAFRSELGRRFAGLLQQLVAGNFMTADEARELPPLKITVQINDIR